jgi:hypothetical protein
MKYLLLTVAAAAALALGFQSSPALAASDCVLAQGSGQTQLNPGNGRIEGWFSFVIGGVPMNVFSSTEILAEEQRGAVSFLTTSHQLTLPDGTVVTTLDNARLVPTREPGVFHAVSNLDVVSGASGFLVGRGSIDFTGLPTATWPLATGRLCGLGL